MAADPPPIRPPSTDPTPQEPPSPPNQIHHLASPDPDLTKSNESSSPNGQIFLTNTLGTQISPNQANKTPDLAIEAPETQVTILPWATRFKSSLRNLHRAEAPSFLEDGTPVVKAPPSVILKGSEIWADYLVARFFGDPPPPSKLFADLNPIWGKLGQISLRKASEFFYYVLIPNKSTREWALQVEFWKSGGTAFTVAEWSKGSSSQLQEPQSVPIWVMLSNIPSALYTVEGISNIATAVGEPLNTANSKLGSPAFGEARVKVEIQLNTPLPKIIVVEDIYKNSVRINTFFPRLPLKCDHCGKLGHAHYRCPIKRKGGGLGSRQPKTKEKESVQEKEDIKEKKTETVAQVWMRKEPDQAPKRKEILEAEKSTEFPSTASKEIGSKSTTYPDTQGQSNKPPTNTLDNPQVKCVEAVNVPSQAGIEPVPSQDPVQPIRGELLQQSKNITVETQVEETPEQEGSNSLVHGSAIPAPQGNSLFTASASTEEGGIIASAQKILRARLQSPCSVNTRKTMGKKKRKPLTKSLSLFKFTDYG